MRRSTAVLVFFLLVLAVSFVGACGAGGGTSSGSGGTVCNNGCYCPGGCGQLYKCSTGLCNDTFCCCGGGSCTTCGCS